MASEKVTNVGKTTSIGVSDAFVDISDINRKNLEQQISDERQKLSTDRMDISFSELINMYKNKEIIIRPEYQRLFRWTSTQKTDFIESILLGIPLPPIFVAEDNNGIWEIVDGLQRASTIISFFGELGEDLSNIREAQANDENDDEPQVIAQNKWVLESGSLITDLEGFSVDTLPKKFVLNIKRATCRVEILRGSTNTGMKYELFKRLNSGGSTLTPQEIRNAIYRGTDNTINLLTEELSKDERFTKVVPLSKQKLLEQYDQELILRFIAFVNKVDEINSNTEKYLDDFMATHVYKEKFDADYYRDLFIRTVSLLSEVGDGNLFKNKNKFFVPAYYEGVMIGVAQNIDKYEKMPSMILERVNQLKSDVNFRKYSGSSSNSRSRIKNRLKIASEIFAK